MIPPPALSLKSGQSGLSDRLQKRLHGGWNDAGQAIGSEDRFRYNAATRIRTSPDKSSASTPATVRFVVLV